MAPLSHAEQLPRKPAGASGDKKKRVAPRKKVIDKILRDVFGLDSLRDGQQPVIDSVLESHDTLAIMPTGSGKSLCYQIPASILSGATIVVSPLISLMKDQLEKLVELGIDAVQVNSSLSHEEELDALHRIGEGQAGIVFCTPERLTSPDFLRILKKTAVALIVIDEAHCISQWGHDFRPAYLELAAAIAALGRPPVLALTATATETVIADIARQLHLPDMRVINTGIYRPNLQYSVTQTTNLDEKSTTAIRLARETQGAGIIYAATVKAVKALHDALLQEGESVTCYHGKLSANERKEHQHLFMNGERRIMIATNAFGMGIDKSDTRFVIHLQVPANLEAYYQESGRAGRDGLPAQCTLLYLQDDKRIQQFFLATHLPQPEELLSIFNTAQELATEAEKNAFSFSAIARKLEDISSGKLKICLKLLKDGKLLRQNRTLDYLVKTGAPRPDIFSTIAQQYIDKQERDRAALEKMVSYAQSGFCRWKLLLDYFEDQTPIEHCGQCDNCLSPPAAMPTIEDHEHFATPSADDEPASTLMQETSIIVGSRVKVPTFDTGSVVTIDGDKITIAFPDDTVRTFMAEFVTLADEDSALKPAVA